MEAIRNKPKLKDDILYIVGVLILPQALAISRYLPALSLYCFYNMHDMQGRSQDLREGGA